VVEFTETIIVGGGQGGLAISYCLKQGRARTPGPRASACHCQCLAQSALGFIPLVTPNFQVRMPGAEYDGNDPYGFMSLREVVKYFDDYDNDIACLSVAVSKCRASRSANRFPSSTTDRDYEAKNVVIATGLYHLQKSRPLRQDSRGHSSVAFHAIPQSFCPAPRRGSSDWDRASERRCREKLYSRREGRSISRSAAQAACPVPITRTAPWGRTEGLRYCMECN